MAQPKQTGPQYKLRLTLELKQLLDFAAKNNNRTLNAEILDRLETTFAQDVWLAHGTTGYSMLVGCLEEEMEEHRELKETHSREYGLERFDAMKDEIISAVRDLKGE